MKAFFKNYWPLIIFSTQVILYLYNNNIGLLYLHYLYRPLLLSFTVTLILTLLLNKLIKDSTKVLYLMQILLIFFFSYGFYQRFIFTDYNVVSLISKSNLLKIFYLLAFLSAVCVLFFPKVNLKKFSNILTTIFAVTFVWNLFLLAYLETHSFWSYLNEGSEKIPSYTNNTNNKPDIYLITLDGHARQDILKNLYNYDDAPFISDLKKRGFLVQDEAVTNYTQTYLAITSLLKMGYLSPEASGISKNSDNRIVLTNTMAKNSLMASLIKSGYDLNVYTTGWTGSEALKRIVGDQKIKWEMSEFEFGILNNTMAPLILGDKFFHAIHASRIRHIFGDIPNIANNPNPTFTYAHILVPHPPFIFKEDGSFANENRVFTYIDSEIKKLYSGGKSDYKNSYVSQLKYTDKEVIQTIDGILSKSMNPPIIILMSDHGPGMEYSYDNPSDVGIKERFSVLRAIYMPNGDYGDFTNVHSHINVFRVILNKYFGANLPYVPDTNLYNSPFEQPYNFEDMTSRYYGK